MNRSRFGIVVIASLLVGGAVVLSGTARFFRVVAR